MAETTPVPLPPEQPPSGAPRPRRRRRWSRRVLAGLFLAGVLAGGAAAAVITSRPGHRMVLDAVLGRVGGALAGSLTVGDVRTSNLLGGALLVDVQLDAEGGRRFLEADSVRLRYSVLSLLGGPPKLAAVTLYGLRVEISRYSGEESMNVARLLAPTADTVPRQSGAGFAVGSIRVVDGAIEVLTPLEGEPSPRALHIADPSGEGTLKRLALQDVDLLLQGVLLAGEEGTVLSGELADLAMEVHLLDEPLQVVHARGTVRFGDAGLTVEEGHFRLPASTFGGSLTLGPSAGGEGAWGFGLDVATEGSASLSDLAWMDPRVPDGVVRGALSLTAGESLEMDLRGVEVESGVSRVAVDGGVRVGDGVVLQGLELRAGPLALVHLQPWLDQELPLDGWLSGNLRLSGSAGSLASVGRVTLVPTGFGGGPTTADLNGTLHLLDDPGVTDLRLTLDPLNTELARALRPGLDLPGRGSARIDASGRISSGIRFSTALQHGDPGNGESRALVQGSVRRPAGGSWNLDVEADLSPLSLQLVAPLVPALAPRGSVTGSVALEGTLAALLVTGDLASGGGTLRVEALVDLENPAHPYRLEAEAEQLDLSAAVDGLPDPFRWTGRLEAHGRGLSPDSAEATGALTGRGSRIGGLLVDSLATVFTLGGGALRLDTLAGSMGGFHVDGSGEVGLVDDAFGEVRVAFHTSDLVGLRPLFMGESVVARDTLTVLEQQLLRLQGVDTDTLPLLADVAMAGTMDGDLVLSGTLAAMGLKGGVRIRDGVFGADRVGSVDLHLDGRDLTGPGRRVDVALEVRDMDVVGRSFSAVEGLMGLDGRSGDAAFHAIQSTGERYALEGTFALDTAGGGVVEVRRAVLDVDSLAWSLARPASITWDTASVTLSPVEIRRLGDDPMRLRAEGTLAWAGTSDLRVNGEALQLDLLARIAQWEGPATEGRLDLTIEVTGESEDPAIQGRFRVREPRYGDLSLESLAGSVEYAHREALVEVDATEGGRAVFAARGSVPVDLALRPRGRRVVDQPMDIRVEADALDAALLLNTLTFLEDVEGAVSGDFHIGGPLDRPAPSGVLTLSEAAWSIEALGVRHSRVSGSLTLNPDRSLDVAVDGRAGGTSTVRGRVVLDPLSDARLDLTIGFRGFQAVNRRDMAGLMSGEVRLVGSYRAPRVEGSLSVDQGTLFLEEFVRSAEVVDLTDPRIFQVVDTTALASRPLLAGIRNPFLQNLRADVDLSVPRDTWLRSEDMNVEIGGDLLVRYDRVSRDVVMVGELEALRGSYTVLGRRFDVQGGTVGFIGTPGVNPTLDLQAVSRIRRVDGDPLDVTAAVEGTLTQPRVTLSSDDQGIAESDLVSYLIFGRPSYELGTGQEAWLGGAAGSFVGAATGAGVNFLSGTLAARLGAALSQQIGLDYLSITQAGDFGVLSGSLGGSLAGTQVEVGQYVGDRIFFVLVFRPLTGQNTSQGFFGGVRMEVALTDDYNVQAFWEDRFLRSRIGGFGDLGIQASQVKGVFIFREWGY